MPEDEREAQVSPDHAETEQTKHTKKASQFKKISLLKIFGTTCKKNFADQKFG